MSPTLSHFSLLPGRRGGILPGEEKSCQDSEQSRAPSTANLTEVLALGVSPALPPMSPRRSWERAGGAGCILEGSGGGGEAAGAAPEQSGSPVPAALPGAPGTSLATHAQCLRDAHTELAAPSSRDGAAQLQREKEESRRWKKLIFPQQLFLHLALAAAARCMVGGCKTALGTALVAASCLCILHLGPTKGASQPCWWFLTFMETTNSLPAPGKICILGRCQLQVVRAV